MVLAKPTGMKPRALAEAIAPRLMFEGVVKVDVAGPGFINLSLDPSAFARGAARRARGSPRFGASDIGLGAKINVEYVSANPTGPLHVGMGGAPWSATRSRACSPSPGTT